MPRARARQFLSSGLGFGLETQKPGLGLGLGLETCWTRTRTRVLRIWTRTRTRTRDMRTRTRLGLEETRTRRLVASLVLIRLLILNEVWCNIIIPDAVLLDDHSSSCWFSASHRQSDTSSSTVCNLFKSCRLQQI